MSESSAVVSSPDLVRTLRAAGCVFAEDEADLLIAAAGPTELAGMVQRRVDGEPLEYILGWAEFCGLRIGVGPGIFVPRRRTEYLVELAVGLVRADDRGACVTVLDMCCGTGAIGIAVATALASSHRVELHACDVDIAAVHCARRNIGDAGHTYLGDLFAPLPAGLRGRVDILTANVPYVPSAAISLMPPEARLYESRDALDGGPDGLAVLRRLSAAAAGWLRPGGHLLVETGELQAPFAIETFVRDGLSAGTLRSAAIGATVIVGTRPLAGAR